MTPAADPELERMAELDAWREYLTETHGLKTASARYEEIEPWAWAKLSQRLAAISGRGRSRVAEAAKR